LFSVWAILTVGCGFTAQAKQTGAIADRVINSGAKCCIGNAKVRDQETGQTFLTDVYCRFDLTLFPGPYRINESLFFAPLHPLVASSSTAARLGIPPGAF
jgi:hypothetical protein